MRQRWFAVFACAMALTACDDPKSTPNLDDALMRDMGTEDGAVVPPDAGEDAQGGDAGAAPMDAAPPQ